MTHRTYSFLIFAALLVAPSMARVKLTMSVVNGNDDAGDKRIKALLDLNCKTDAIKAFGIKVDPERKKAFASDFGELEYCRKNRASCCSAAELDAVVPKYYTAYKSMLKMMEPIEEMATLFRGNKFKEEILDALTTKAIEKKNCQKYTLMPNNLGSLPFNLEDKETFSLYQEVNALLAELDYYTKRQGWFYGDLICSICNPEDQEYIDINGDKLTVTASSSTCSELFDMKEWELRLGIVYSKFLRPVANTYACISTEDDKEVDAEDLLPELDIQGLSDALGKYQACQGEFSVKDKNCLEMCKASLSTMHFSEEILRAYSNALKAYFPPLTDMEIDEYYVERKGEEFKDSPLGSVEFFEVTGYAGDKLELSYAEHGINVFNNHWSKKFLEYGKLKKKKEAAESA